MRFRQAVSKDQESILAIIRQAQAYFQKQGIDQWQNGYPNPETVRRDIGDGNAYVLTREDKVIGTVAVFFEEEEAYRDLYGGEWFDGGTYAVIHRIAMEDGCKGKGLSTEIVGQVEDLCQERGVHSIRVDTHRDNISMQRMLEKNGFSFCGGIFLADGSPRIAFEKII